MKSCHVECALILSLTEVFNFLSIQTFFHFSYLSKYHYRFPIQGLAMKNNSMVFTRQTYRTICHATLGFLVYLWHRGIVRVKLLRQKPRFSEWLSGTKEVQLKDCDWGDTIFYPITFDFHLLVVILVSMSPEPQESCFMEDLPFKAISFIQCGEEMERESVGVLQHIEISFTDVQYLKQSLRYSFAKWSLLCFSCGKLLPISQSA